MARRFCFSKPLKTDVVIIGFGPVGAMLANLLGLQGISTLVLEREAEILTCLVQYILTTRSCGCCRRLTSRKPCSRSFMSRPA